MFFFFRITCNYLKLASSRTDFDDLTAKFVFELFTVFCVLGFKFEGLCLNCAKDVRLVYHFYFIAMSVPDWNGGWLGLVFALEVLWSFAWVSWSHVHLR